jgi:2-polyprenyl-3-methyl-5-hydroxy-6-metoxy-1,4-benzoquinol methylase
LSDSVEERERAFFDRHYQEVARNPAGFALRVRRELAALRRLTGNRRLGRLISIGCGDGHFECLLAPHVESVLGIDLSSTAIERARARAAAQGLTNVEFRCQPASGLDPDERFDGIACVAFLHHVAEPELPALLANLFARLRPAASCSLRSRAGAVACGRWGIALLGCQLTAITAPTSASSTRSS